MSLFLLDLHSLGGYHLVNVSVIVKVMPHTHKRQTICLAMNKRDLNYIPQTTLIIPHPSTIISY